MLVFFFLANASDFGSYTLNLLLANVFRRYQYRVLFVSVTYQDLMLHIVSPYVQSRSWSYPCSSRILWFHPICPLRSVDLGRTVCFEWPTWRPFIVQTGSGSGLRTDLGPQARTPTFSSLGMEAIFPLILRRVPTRRRRVTNRGTAASLWLVVNM
jgi:hypothetical protein